MSDPTSPRGHDDEPKSFMPKTPVSLAPPKDDAITYEELNKYDGSDPSGKILVAIKGTVFDVSKNSAYQKGGAYHVFAGKDPSRALAQSSLKPEDCVPDWQDLQESHKTVLNEWYTFFSRRYNVVGKIEGAMNTGA